MRICHKLQIASRCPVDGSQDIYQCSVYVTDRLLPCEEIAKAVTELTGKPIYQESLTQRLADWLKATVKTVGRHKAGNIRTSVVCKPAAPMG